MLNENINTAMILTEYFHRLLDRKTVKSFKHWSRQVVWAGEGVRAQTVEELCELS
jgi:hypothetical protein